MIKPAFNPFDAWEDDAAEHLTERERGTLALAAKLSCEGSEVPYGHLLLISAWSRDAKEDRAQFEQVLDGSLDVAVENGEVVCYDPATRRSPESIRRGRELLILTRTGRTPAVGADTVFHFVALDPPPAGMTHEREWMLKAAVTGDWKVFVPIRLDLMIRGDGALDRATEAGAPLVEDEMQVYVAVDWLIEDAEDPDQRDLFRSARDMVLATFRGQQYD